MIRKSTPEDYQTLLRLYAVAREAMKQSGNPTQWGEDRPYPARIEADIQTGIGYVIERDGRICGAFALLQEPEPTYAHIDGAWQSDSPYITLHRVASDGTARGVMHEMLAFADSVCPCIRIDTHENNRIMQHILQKEGFTYCGVITLADGAPRLAYQRCRTSERNIE